MNNASARAELARLVWDAATGVNDSPGSPHSLEMVRLAARHRVADYIDDETSSRAKRAAVLLEREHERSQVAADAEVLAALRMSLDTIVLKGSVSKALLTPGFARASADLDVLVPPDQIDQAGSILRDLGYSQSEHKYINYDDHHHDAPWRRESGGSHVVEVHRHPLRNPIGREVDVARFWNNAEVLDLGGLPVLRLGDVDLALHVAVHAFHGKPATLRSLLEAGLALRRLSPSSRRELVDRADTPLLSRSLAWSLILVDATYPEVVPPDSVDRLSEAAEIGRVHRRVGTAILERFGTDLDLWYGLQFAMRGFLDASGVASGLFEGARAMLRGVRDARAEADRE